MTLHPRRYYHYTALHHAEEIVACGAITRGGISIPDPSGEYLDRIERPWQWLTKSSEWAQPWATMHHIDCDRTEVRFLIEIPLLELDRLRRWDDVAADFGYSPEAARHLAQLGGGDSSGWYVFGGQIPKRWIASVETRPGRGGDPTVPSDVSSPFGELLRSLRLAATAPTRYPDGRGRWAAAPLSLNQVARLAGVNVAYVYRLEKAIETAPSRSVVEKLAAALEADELNTAQLLVRAGYWPWPELDADDTVVALGVLLAIRAGDYRRLHGVETLEPVR